MRRERAFDSARDPAGNIKSKCLQRSPQARDCITDISTHGIWQARLHKALEHDSARAARFFYVLCLSMEIQIRSLTTHTFPGTWSSGKLMRSKEVEDLRSNMQVQSAPKITRGQTLVLSSISSPKAPASPKKVFECEKRTKGWKHCMQNWFRDSRKRKALMMPG